MSTTTAYIASRTSSSHFRSHYQRKTEHHLFKWVDEAIVDEINMVDAKHSQLKEDVDSYKIYTSKRLEIQAKHIEQTLHQLKILMDAKTDSCCTQDSPAFTTESTLASPTVAATAYNPLTNIAVAAIALGTMAWIYASQHKTKQQPHISFCPHPHKTPNKDIINHQRRYLKSNKHASSPKSLLFALDILFQKRTIKNNNNKTTYVLSIGHTKTNSAVMIHKITSFSYTPRWDKRN
ncbi:hypothetical protein YC2023_073453 [Brassica napus]